jgi:glycosyltransferase involved in cell wall biosynthesis
VSRALHIVDAATSPDDLAQVALLAGEADAVASAGPPPRRTPAEFTPPPVRAFHAPLGLPALSGRRMAAFADAFDVIHALSPAAALAALAAGRRAGKPVILSLTHPPRRRPLRTLLAALLAGEATAAVPTEALRRHLLRLGAPEAGVRVLPPAAAAVDARDERRQRTRRALGLGEDAFVVAAPGEVTHAAGQKYVCWAHAIVRNILPSLCTLVPGTGRALRSVKFFGRNTGYGGEILFTDGRVAAADALAAADAAAFFGARRTPAAPLAAAMAAPLPTAATDTPVAAELTDRGRAAILIPPNEPREAAAAVLRLIEDGEHAGRLSAAAAAIAAERFAPPRCRERLEAIYAEAGGAASA